MLRFSILPSVLFSILLLACWPVSENDLKRLTNFKISDRVHWLCRFFTNIFPFYDSRLNFGKGQEFLWKIMPQNVTLKFNLVPFLARGLKWRCFWGGRDFSGSIFNFLPFLCEKCPFLRYLCLLGKADQFFSQGWELFVQEFGTGLKLCSQSPQFSKKCHEQFYC